MSEENVLQKYKYILYNKYIDIACKDLKEGTDTWQSWLTSEAGKYIQLYNNNYNRPITISISILPAII